MKFADFFAGCLLAAALLAPAVAADEDAPVLFARIGKYGYRDKSGKYVVEPQFD